MLGGTEILIIGGAIVAVCFGPKILMSWGKGAGESIREYRRLKQEFNAPLTDKHSGANRLDKEDGTS